MLSGKSGCGWVTSKQVTTYKLQCFGKSILLLYVKKTIVIDNMSTTKFVQNLVNVFARVVH